MSTPQLVDLADMVFNARVEKGLTQVELAALAGCSQKSVSRIERAQMADPGTGTLVRISTALGLNPLLVIRPFFGTPDGTDTAAVSIAAIPLRRRPTPEQVAS